MHDTALCVVCFRSARVPRGVGRRSCAGSAGSTQVPRGPRGLAGPFHQVARVHAGPRILEEARERESSLEGSPVLGVRGNCSLASCVKHSPCMAWVHAGSAQVLCGFKSSIHCLRGGEAIEARSHAGPAHGCRGPDSNCVARVHAGPRLEGSFLSGLPQAIIRRGATRVLRGSRGSHAGPAVPRGSHAGPSQVPRRSTLHCAGPTHRLGF